MYVHVAVIYLDPGRGAVRAGAQDNRAFYVVSFMQHLEIEEAAVLLDWLSTGTD